MLGLSWPEQELFKKPSCHFQILRHAKLRQKIRKLLQKVLKKNSGEIKKQTDTEFLKLTDEQLI